MSEPTNETPAVPAATEVIAVSVDMALMAMPGASDYTMAEQVRIGVEAGLRHLIDVGVVTIAVPSAFPEVIQWPSPVQIGEIAKERAARA